MLPTTGIYAKVEYDDPRYQVCSKVSNFAASAWIEKYSLITPQM
jgi:hypothetical protein